MNASPTPSPAPKGVTKVRIEKLTDKAKLEKKTPGAAAYDIYAVKRDFISPQESKLIRVGFKIEIPEGFVGEICSRSGMALEKCVWVANAPGIIDSDYRGEVGVILYNGGFQRYVAEEGDRIAQLIIRRVAPTELNFEDIVSETVRGADGFGSTGR